MYFFAFGLTVSFWSCKKDTEPTTNVSNYQITATRGMIFKKKQPNEFTINCPANFSVTWKVVPPTGVYYSTDGNNAYMRFNNPGKYIVYASFGATSDSTIITVDSTIYAGDTSLPGNVFLMDTIATIPPYKDSSSITKDTVISFNGGTLNIVPSVLSDSMGGSNLFLNSSTSQLYPNAKPQIIDSITYTYPSGSYSINGVQIQYIDVYLQYNWATSWTGVNSIAKGSDLFTKLSDGTYNLGIYYSGILYKGSFTKTGNTYTFNWANNGPVIISPLSVHL